MPLLCKHATIYTIVRPRTRTNTPAPIFSFALSAAAKSIFALAAVVSCRALSQTSFEHIEQYSPCARSRYWRYTDGVPQPACPRNAMWCPVARNDIPAFLSPDMPAVTPRRTAAVECAWCKTTYPTTEAYMTTCSPDFHTPWWQPI